MSLPEGILQFYRYEDGVLPRVGAISWDGAPTITSDGVEPGNGPSIAGFTPGETGAALVLKIKTKQSSASIVGDMQIFGPIYLSSEGVKVKVGDSVSLYPTTWAAGDILVLNGHFLDGQQRGGLILQPIVIPVDPPVLSGRSINTGALPYAASSIPEPYKTKSRVWLADKFDFMINGGADASFNPNNFYAFYFKSNYYPTDLPKIKNWCIERTISYEDMFNHISIDYTPASVGWKERDKYTVFLGTVDKTTYAYDATNNITPTGVLDIGHESPFDQINVDITTPGENVVTTCQYWNGTDWVTLAKTDGTAGWTQDGQISFVPPSDWTDCILHGGATPAWWVRITFVSATASPVVQKLYGDNWYTGSLCRGWDGTSETIINEGTPVAYNPTPPVGATAKFRHQGRVTGYWTSGNLHMLNFDMMVDGDYPAKRYVADSMLSAVAWNPNANAVMWDTAFSYGMSTFIKAPADALDYCESPFNATVQMDRFSYVRDAVKAVNDRILFGGNNYGAPSAAFEISEWGLLEYFEFYNRFPGRSNNSDVTSESTRFTKSDGYLPENNPTGIKGVFMYCDAVDHDAVCTGFWDRSNRGPMVALANHYIVGNENLYFTYYSQGGYRYDFSDELLYYKDETTLAAPITADTSNAVKTITGVDFSGLDRTALGLGLNSITKEAYANIGLRIRIGDDIFAVTKIDGTTVTTTAPIYQSHEVGASVRFVGCKHLGTDPVVPPADDVYRWNWWFPAMGVNIGVPDATGYNGGARDKAWKTAAEVGGPEGTEVWRRDYTGAIVLLRGGLAFAGYKPSYITPCEPIDLGDTYFPLYADGTIGAGITTIQLRAGEGAILLKVQP